MNVQPFCRDKGPHQIYLFHSNATSVGGEAATLPFSVYKHLSNIRPSRLSLFMTLSQNAEFNHPKTEIFGSTCANSTEAFFEAHRNFALTYNANKTSIVLYRITSLYSSSLRFHLASSCLSVIPQLCWVTSGEWFRALSFSGFTVLFDSLRAYCGKEIMYNFGFTPHRTLPVVATSVGLSITWHLPLFGDISFHPINHSA